MTNQPSSPASLEGVRPTRPYPPSWVDRLISAVDKLPGPAWLAYLACLLSVTLLSHAVRWIDGSLPAASLDTIRVAEAPFLILFPALQQYLNSTARHALEGFRPALQVGDDEYARLQYQLTTIPSRAGGVTGAIGAALGLLSLLSSPLGYGVTPQTSLLTDVIAVFFAMLLVAFAAVFTYHTIRQLRLVASVHRMAMHINLFQLAPVHSFSTLTSRTGIAIILTLTAGYVFSSYVNLRLSAIALSPVDFVIMGFLFLVALACFILPLNSMHHRLSQEKTRLLAEVNRRLEATINTVHERLDRGEFHTMDQMEKALANLITERKVLTEVSTWPWRPETLRGFLSTLALPVILYVITATVGRILGL
jgi:ABC-type multidrug transport system fused ATPase/permease subunit